jgi:transcriptional regulator of acetoin/glycerol metabolism
MLRLSPPPHQRSLAFHSGLLAPHEVAGDPVLARWDRVRALGRAHDGPSHPEGVSDADLAERRARFDAAFGEHEKLGDSLVEDLLPRKVTTLLADADGVIVRARVDRFARRAAELRLVEGVSWNERARGVNAIGTALAERQEVAVIGGAHYELTNQGLFCYATPLFDPYGEVLGAFDVSGQVEDDDPVLATTVRYVGMALESALRATAYATAIAGGLRVVERMLERCAMPALLVEAAGIRMNERARSTLGPSTDPLTMESIFGVGWNELARRALAAPRATMLDTKAGRFSLTLDPLVGPQGRVLSVLAYLDPFRARLPAPPEHPAFAAIMGSDPEIVRAKASASRIAATNVPVLLVGEVGTGKEPMARAIHTASRRAEGPFVTLSCGATPPHLLEGELFGYVPGALAGIRAIGYEGRIAAAQGGTLFLEDIEEMPVALQSLLVRVLDDGSYTRLGETAPRQADVRLLCASARDLSALASSGRFRADLFYRIQGATISLPPLRKRRDRVPLAEALLTTLADTEALPRPALSTDAVAHIEAHDWPGNVRELESALRHALLLGPRDDLLSAKDFPQVVAQDHTRSEARSMREAEAEALETALRVSSGNMSAAARKLGISRSTLYRMLGRIRRPG